MQQVAELKASATVESLAEAGNFQISFQHLDREQGQSFGRWQETTKLSEAMETLRNYSARPLRSQLDGKKFTEYGDFPPDAKTKFAHPAQVPPDASWARIHVDGLHCLIGHLVENTFYLVFLDENHEFWISELKHT
ncbi:hypothetical protein AXW84_18445 [Hymenobacter sp. PAMC 26628]|nr:hypothetical protein AXW84_18445 [Hymenobacter sp. PAMC 26628]